MSSVSVLADSAAIINLVNDIQHSPARNPILQLLASGNQNVVGQVITSVSLQFNQMNNENIDQAISSILLYNKLQLILDFFQTVFQWQASSFHH